MADETTNAVSRRESLAAAMEALEEGEGAHADTETDIEPGEATENPAEAAAEESAAAAEVPAESAADRDDRGRFKSKAEDKAAAEVKPKEEPAPREAAPKLKDEPPLPVVRAPQAWKPAVRELVSKLPLEFRPIVEEANRRERDAARLAQDNAQLRQGIEQAKQSGNPYREAVAPFENSIRQRGGEPRQFVASLLQTEHMLSSAQPHQRADLLARLVVQYGRDVLQPDRQDAQGNQSSPLDRALVALMSGQSPQPAQAQPQRPQEFRDPRLDQLLAQQQQRQQAAEAQAAEEAVQVRDSFAEAHEFYEDVKEQVADILDVWAKRGKRDVSDEDLERAYHIACRDNPDVAPIFEQRQAAEAARKAKASTARARAASTSVRPAPVLAAAPSDNGKPLSRRESMRRAMDDLEQRGSSRV